MRRVSIFALFMMCAQCAFSNIYHVSTSGNDNTGDGSAGNPWRSLRSAVGKVPGGQGHTIRLAAGTFVESGSFNVPPGVNIEGAGVDQTIIKAASSFFYNPGDPGFALDKFLMTLNSSTFSEGNQVLKNFTIDGDGKKLHGGIYVKNRNRIIIEGVKVRETNFCGIWIWDVKNSALRQVTLINCSWGSAGWASGGLQLANLESVELTGLNIDENTGYGIKALGSGGNRISRMKFHDSRISVNPVGKWNNGSAANIAFELWEVYLTDCEIYNTYMDNHLSLVNVQTAPTGGRSIRVHHNVFDLLERAGGHGYAIELSINDAEIDNNWIKGGSYGIAHWSPAYCANWSIHHNTFHSLSSGYPGDILRAQVSGLHNVKFYNNTVELMGNSTINVIGMHAGKSDNLDLKNNLIINSNTGYSWFPNQLIFLEKGASVSALNVSNNLLDKLPIGTVGGTYSNNLLVSCKINQSGARPSPYYSPAGGSPLIDAGVNVSFPFQGSAPDIGAHEFMGAAAPSNQLPSVVLTAPADNANFNKGSSISIAANASDKDGTISKVEFFSGAIKLGEDTTTPYSFAWQDIPAGTHTLSAKATDNAGGSTTSSPVKIEVSEATNALPAITITSPAADSKFPASASIKMGADATDTDGTIAKVEFYNGNNKLGEDTSGPYSFEWADVPAGNYTLTAKATDNKGGTTTSSPVKITVESTNGLPTVAITSPAADAKFTKLSTVTIDAMATDPDGTVSKVEFYNGSNKLGEDTSNPYSFRWTDVPAGNHTLTAKATDNNGGATTSSTVKILVESTNGLPTVSITSPAADSKFTASSSVTISASATDSDGTIAKVEFYNGNNKLGEDASSPYSFTWANVPAGTYLLTAKAIDNDGESTTSSAIGINVGESNVLPTVSINSPSNNSVFDAGSPVTITATAADSDGTITKVEFFSSTLKIGEDATNPYSIVWGDHSAGTYTITAKATDDHGGSVTSAPISITIEVPNVPEVEPIMIKILNPQENEIFAAGETITIIAEASGAIKKVEFFSGSARLGEASSAPYRHDWKGAPEGIQTISVKLIGLDGAIATDEVLINVISKPTANAGKDITINTSSSSVQLSGTGTSSDGSAVSYSWRKISGPDQISFNDENSASPTVHDLVEGTYTIELTVTDANKYISTDQVQIYVVGSDLSSTTIPRYFTPNDDGINDKWEWPNIEQYANSALTIFNRAGQKIFEVDTYNNSWDGTLSGTPLQPDAYYYVIRSKDSGDIKGAVRIIR